MAGVGGLSFFPSKSFSKYLPQKTIRARYAKRISAATCRILRTGKSIGLFKAKTSIYRKKIIQIRGFKPEIPRVKWRGEY